MRTLKGRPDLGMRGVNNGAAANTLYIASSNSVCAARSK
jgi:hypothetical protein